jgi:hypothetical protein
MAEDEQSLDLTRPRNLDDFVGQEKLKENLKIFIRRQAEKRAPTMSSSADLPVWAKQRLPILYPANCR